MLAGRDYPPVVGPASIGANASSSTELTMSALRPLAAVPLCRSGYLVADIIESFEL